MTAKRTTAKPKPTAKKAPPAAGLQRHPLSEKFSLPFSEAERLALAEDMKANGQQYEVILHENMVLDGWERYMACLATGLTVKTKQYTGESPAAVAFGANAIRRKLSSVQKALFGAKYFVHCTSEGITVAQKQVASSVCCSLQSLNQIVQLLRKVDTDKKAAKCVAKLSTDPDVTTAMLQQMLGEVGIIDVNARKPKAGTAGPEDEDEDDPENPDNEDLDNNVDDLLGGADIDDLLDDDDPPVRVTPKDKSANPPGTRIGVDKRPRETPASATARDFRALTEPERKDFVKFSWAMLRPAIESCVSEGRVEWPLLHATADAGKAALADVAGALTRGKPSKPVSTAKLAPKKTTKAGIVKPPSKPGKKAAAPAPAPSPGKPAPVPAPAPFPKPAPGGVPPAAPAPAPAPAPAAPVAGKAKTAPAKARKQATADV